MVTFNNYISKTLLTSRLESFKNVQRILNGIQNGAGCVCCRLCVYLKNLRISAQHNLHTITVKYNPNAQILLMKNIVHMRAQII